MKPITSLPGDVRTVTFRPDYRGAATATTSVEIVDDEMIVHFTEHVTTAAEIQTLLRKLVR